MNGRKCIALLVLIVALVWGLPLALALRFAHPLRKGSDPCVRRLQPGRVGESHLNQKST